MPFRFFIHHSLATLLEPRSHVLSVPQCAITLISRYRMALTPPLTSPPPNVVCTCSRPGSAFAQRPFFGRPLASSISAALHFYHRPAYADRSLRGLPRTASVCRAASCVGTPYCLIVYTVATTRHTRVDCPQEVQRIRGNRGFRW